ncbi:MAG: hypothetical protein Q9227_000348 [Pyrenula ochraceoflavens]
MRDLILLQNWSTAAYLGFGDRPGDSRIWQVDVVQLAYNSPFLMRGILAVSALHMAHTHPEREEDYVREATNHQIAALPAYRHALKQITEYNCQALLAFAGLTTVYAFHSACRGQSVISMDANDKEDGVMAPPEWLQLHRGLRFMLTGQIKEWIRNGPMKHQLRSYDDWHFDYDFNPDDFRILSFMSFLEMPAGRSAMSDEEADGLLFSLQHMRQSYALAMSPHIDIGKKFAIWLWAENVPTAYLQLIARRAPQALILLSMACVLLERAAPTCWYLQGAPQRIVSEVYDSLDKEWRPWIAWPISEIGLLRKASDGHDMVLTGDEPVVECEGLGEIAMAACARRSL